MCSRVLKLVTFTPKVALRLVQTLHVRVLAQPVSISLGRGGVGFCDAAGVSLSMGSDSFGAVGALWMRCHWVAPADVEGLQMHRSVLVV